MKKKEFIAIVGIEGGFQGTKEALLIALLLLGC